MTLPPDCGRNMRPIFQIRMMHAITNKYDFMSPPLYLKVYASVREMSIYKNYEQLKLILKKLVIITTCTLRMLN